MVDNDNDNDDDKNNDNDNAIPVAQPSPFHDQGCIAVKNGRRRMDDIWSIYRMIRLTGSR